MDLQLFSHRLLPSRKFHIYVDASLITSLVYFAREVGRPLGARSLGGLVTVPHDLIPPATPRCKLVSRPGEGKLRRRCPPALPDVSGSQIYVTAPSELGRHTAARSQELTKAGSRRKAPGMLLLVPLREAGTRL